MGEECHFWKEEQIQQCYTAHCQPQIVWHATAFGLIVQLPEEKDKS